MGLPGVTQRLYQADLVTQDYLLSGQMAPFGPLLAYLNQNERGILIMKNVQATALEMSSQVDPFHADELVVIKDEVIALRLLDPVSQATVHLLPRREKLLVFTPRIVVQAQFHCGPDTRVTDLFEATPGRWAAASEVKVFPLRPGRTAIFDEANLLLLNKRHIQFYQPVK